MDVVVADVVLLAKVVEYLSRQDAITMVYVNSAWTKALIRPSLWEELAHTPKGPFLATCFRRAASYIYTEMDVPSPNVNRRGSPPTIRGCLLNDRSTIKDYIDELKAMFYEQRRFQDKPRIVLQLPDAFFDDAKAKGDYPSKHTMFSHAFQTVKLIEGATFHGGNIVSAATHVVSGGLGHDGAFFYLWSLHDGALCGTIALASAVSFDICSTALAIGTMDGTVKVWDIASWIAKSPASRNSRNQHPVVILPPSMTLTLRSHLNLAPFLRTRSSQSVRITKVTIALTDGSFHQVAATTEKGDVHVWDASKGDSILSLSTERIHSSALPRANRDPRPQVTSLMLFRNTLVCGTSAGLVRIFDLRSGKLTHRISGHPDAILKTDTKGRVLWTAGRDGSVRWWGGKNPKVCPKSALCRGAISALEMDETAVVAAYDGGGMEAWDVRTQQSLCTFASKSVGGIDSVQFDKRKLVTIAKDGAAYLWRWYSMYPIWTIPSDPVAKYTSVCFDEKHLVLGTTNGTAQVFAMEGTPAKARTTVYDY
ncbi:hypothetical protein AC1031_013333 [Aphanomyces cochlioides]|nr:hypothetical protein AC1031_013333 [Aphanomyces cochlioides]